MPNGTPRVTLDITGIPEAVSAMRRELADALREVARDEDPRTADRLVKIAAVFECGQSMEAGE